MDRIKGTKIQIYEVDEKGLWGEALREYQDPEGWAISDAGLNEDEPGYHFSVRANGVGGQRAISFIITREALKGMLDAVNTRYPTEPKLPVYTTNTSNTSTSNTSTATDFKAEVNWGTYVSDVCDCDGCLCQPKVSV